MYTTEALVCGSYNRGHADRLYYLFTKNLGLVEASAKSVREERSRQRYALQDFSLAQVTLVRGRGGFKIGSVIPLTNFYHNTDSREMRTAIVSVVKSIRRYIHGEEPQQFLYQDSIEGLCKIISTKDEIQQFWTILTESRTLFHLGYVAPSPALQALFNEPLETIEPDFSLIPSLQEIIREARTASHLSNEL